MVDPEVEVRPRVVQGPGGQVLVDAAEGAELLVVGSRGHGGLAEACSDRSASTACITRRARS